MPDILGLFKQALGGEQPEPKLSGNEQGSALGTYDDQELLDLWTRMKRESIDQRWVWERQWQRNLWYVLGRQWIEYFSAYGGWREKRLAPTVPRPVTNLCKETVQTIRAIFTAINIGVNVRPNGQSPENVAAAATGDELSPVIHERQKMDSVMNEFDFWFLVTGNAFLHACVDYDLKYGVLSIPMDVCLGCGEEISVADHVDQTTPCPTCGGIEFEKAVNEDGTPKTINKAKPRPITMALSPLEVAFPNSYARFDDIPYIVRLRWRTKWYFEQHPTLKAMVPDIKFSSSSNDRTLQLFKSLANHNDLGVMPAYLTEGSTGQDEEGVTEYEVHMKPCDAYPEGLVFRVIGDDNPKILHLEDSEAVPGPLPYKDADGQPLFTWTHAGYDPVGGRVLASGPLDQIIQKQDQLNQLDSMILMTMMRLAAGGWLIPKGSEIENSRSLSTPGVIVRWNPLTVGGNAKPERFEGAQINESWFKYREQLIADIERLAGTFDIIKGQKPTGVEAFSALQLLVERSQSRFSWPFKSRGLAYADNYKFQLELEREFGPDEYTKPVLSPARTWTFQTFKRAKLQGSVSVIVEDGSNTPKTSLGMRASVQQAQALGIVNTTDPDTQYEGLKLFGLQRMAPSIDVHVQAALRKQQAFEEWITSAEQVDQAVMGMEQDAQVYAQHAAVAMQQPPTLDPATGAMMPAQPPPPPSPLVHTPLKWLPWYRASIHKQEFEKWANSDRVRQMIAELPIAEPLLIQHYQEIMEMFAVEMGAVMQATATVKGQGSGKALENSNRESTQGVQPSGTNEGAQGQGPA